MKKTLKFICSIDGTRYFGTEEFMVIYNKELLDSIDNSVEEDLWERRLQQLITEGLKNHTVVTD